MMSDSEVKNVLRLWSPSKLYQFLQLREIEVPPGISLENLLSLVLANKDVPILKVRATKTLFYSLSHEQLVQYLQFRGYVIMTKGKIIPQTPEEYVDFQEKELLAGAIADFEENYDTHAEDINYHLEKVLRIKSPVRDAVPEFEEDKTDVPYNPRHVEKLLEKFGVDCLILNPSERLKVARVSFNFFAEGQVY